MTRQPTLILADDDPERRRWAGGIMAAAGWQVVSAERAAVRAMLAAARDGALLLIGMGSMPRDALDEVAAIRGGGTPAASIPIIGIAARGAMPDTRVRSGGLDALVETPCADRVLIAATEPWRPLDAPDPRARLAPLLPATVLDEMFARLRGEMADAIAEVEAGSVDRARAHRLAGLAGTLGFTEVHRHWIALSDGTQVSPGTARIAARMAIHAIDIDRAQQAPAA